jgi:phytoene synthase
MEPLDIALCEGWIREHSKSFYLASRLLPPRVRSASWALYAFCRQSDDAVDEGEQGDAALVRVEGLRRRLDRLYTVEGRVIEARHADPIDRAFAAVAARHGIPRGVPEALIAGMEMDARGAEYRTMEELYLYCFRVASTVGLMMTLVMTDDRRPATLLRACELGVAMQLTNIARDVGEDARRGRVYLPDELLGSCGVGREGVLGASFATWPLREAVRRLLGFADDFYRSSDRGVGLLPLDCRGAIAGARYIYAAIGDEIAAHHHDSVTRRAHTSKARKLALLARAAPLALRPAGPQGPGPADRVLMEQIEGAGVVVRGTLPWM